MKKIKLSTLAVLLTTLLILTQTQECRAQTGIKQQFEQKMSQLIGISVTVEDYRLEYSTIHLSNIKIGDKTLPEMPFLTVKKLSGTCDLMSLFGGNLVLKDVLIASLTCELTRNETGEFVTGKAASPKQTAEKKKIADLPFLKLEIVDLTLKINDKKGKQTISTHIDTATLAKTKLAEQLATNFSGSAKATSHLGKQTGDFETAFSGKLNLNGALPTPSIDGTISIKDLHLTNKVLGQTIKLAQGSFSFAENSIKTSNLKAAWGKSVINISGQLSDLRKRVLAMTYSIDPINMAEISNALISTQGFSVSGIGSSKGQITGTPTNISLTGTLELTTCNLTIPLDKPKNDSYIFPFTNLFAAYRYSAGEIKIDKATTSIFSGHLNGSGNVFITENPVRIQMRANAAGIRAEKFLSENSTEKNAISGPIDANISANGNSSGLNTWNGSGNFSMRNGSYQAPPVITPVLSLVNLREFSSGTIQSGQGTFQMRNGILTTNDLVFISNAGKAFYRGNVGLDTSLSGKMNIVFAQEAVKSSPALQQISLDGKSADLPTNVAGTLLSPSFPGFSPQGLLELGLKRQGQKLLQDLIFKRKSEPADAGNVSKEENNDPGKQIMQGLQNIFKKKRNAAPEHKPAPQDLGKDLKKLFNF